MSPVYREAMGFAAALHPPWFSASAPARAAATPATAEEACSIFTPGLSRPIIRTKRDRLLVAGAPSSTRGVHISVREGWAKPGGITPTTV